MISGSRRAFTRPAAPAFTRPAAPAFAPDSPRQATRPWVQASVIVLLLSLALPLAAQDAAYTATTEHYLVRSQVSRAHAQNLAHQLEAFLELYNRHFRFPLEQLESPLPVRVFGSRGGYDDYLDGRITEPSEDFVYLHYSDPRQRELVGYTGHGSTDRALIHHSFVQYLRAFVPNPPLWIREGYAVYFAHTRYNAEYRRATYAENLAWLDTLKAMMAGTAPRPWIAWEDLLFSSPSEVRDTAESFYPQAWGLVTFLLNDEDPQINRLAWDSIGALNAEYSLEENNEAVYRSAFRWEEPQELKRRFSEYFSTRRTFAGWISTGVERYDRDDHEGAEHAMVEALQLRTDHDVPFYYLGLIHYDRGEFETAADYYQQALERTDSPGPVLYALGVNAFAQDRLEDARQYVESIPGEDPDLREQAEALLRRLPATSGR